MRHAASVLFHPHRCNRHNQSPSAAIIVVSHKTLKFDLVNNRIAEAHAPGVDYVVACSSAALPFGRGYNCEIDRLDEFGNSRA